MENLVRYIIINSVDVQSIVNSWDIDFCTFEEFYDHILDVWCFGHEIFKNANVPMTFSKFFKIQLLLLFNEPKTFKIAIELKRLNNGTSKN